jgi:hypothetical protein
MVYIPELVNPTLTRIHIISPGVQDFGNLSSYKIGLTQILPTSRAVTRVLPLCYRSVTTFDAGHSTYLWEW